MTITLYSASVPVFIRTLNNLKHFLQKAQADVSSRGYDEQALVQFRLAPDMLPFKSQIYIACDAAKLCAARIGGLDAPKHDNIENNLADLIARIPVGKDKTRTMLAEDYLKSWALPNVFFHTTTAYAILRHNGVALGKIDFLLGAGD